MEDSDVIDLAERKIKATSKNISYQRRDLVFLQKQLAAYQPNILEPSRTVNALSKLLNSARKEFYKRVIKPVNFCFTSDNGGIVKRRVRVENSSTLQLELTNINLNNYFNELQIIDDNTGNVLEEITSMQRDSWLSPVYPTNSVVLLFNVKASIKKEVFALNQ